MTKKFTISFGDEFETTFANINEFSKDDYKKWIKNINEAYCVGDLLFEILAPILGLSDEIDSVNIVDYLEKYDGTDDALIIDDLKKSVLKVLKAAMKNAE